MKAINIQEVTDTDDVVLGRRMDLAVALAALDCGPKDWVQWVGRALAVDLSTRLDPDTSERLVVLVIEALAEEVALAMGTAREAVDATKREILNRTKSEGELS